MTANSDLPPFYMQTVVRDHYVILSLFIYFIGQKYAFFWDFRVNVFFWGPFGCTDCTVVG